MFEYTNVWKFEHTFALLSRDRLWSTTNLLLGKFYWEFDHTSSARLAYFSYLLKFPIVDLFAFEKWKIAPRCRIAFGVCRPSISVCVHCFGRICSWLSQKYCRFFPGIPVFSQNTNKVWALALALEQFLKRTPVFKLRTDIILRNCTRVICACSKLEHINLATQ